MNLTTWYGTKIGLSELKSKMPHTSFMDDFKTVYNEKGKHDLKAQIPFLSKLADRYKKRGKKDPRKRWSDLLKVSVLLISCWFESYMLEEAPICLVSSIF